MTKIDFARYADDHPPYEPLNSFKWFIGNPLETNNNKYYLMTNMQNCMNLKIENKNAQNSTCVKI